MTKNDLQMAVLETLDAIDALEREKKRYMKEYREARAQYLRDLAEYRARLRDEHEQLVLGEGESEEE